LVFASITLASAVGQAANPAQFQKSNSQPGNSSLVRDAAMLLEAGKLEEAEAVARRAVAGQPRNTAARSVLGAILDQRGLRKEAEDEFREALRLDANSTVALTNLGVLLVRTGRTDEAVTTFARVLRLQPGHAQATFNLGALYAARKEYVSAIPLLERAAGSGKNSARSDVALTVTLANAPQSCSAGPTRCALILMRCSTISE